MATAPISFIQPQVIARLEETNPPVFWDLNYEINSAITEAINDLMLLVGRPTQTVQQIVAITPNTPWQTMPNGVFCMTNLYSTAGEIYKMTQFDVDYAQINWGSDWENDIGLNIDTWWPLGFNMFGIHPSLPAAAQVQVTGIAVTTTEAWPYDGNVQIPFQRDVFDALEMYAAHYCRLKEGGNEFTDTYEMYKSYLGLAQRLSEISDRRDPYIFTRTLGAQVGVNPVTQR